MQESRNIGGFLQHEPVLAESNDEDTSEKVSQYIEEITHIFMETAVWF